MMNQMMRLSDSGLVGNGEYILYFRSDELGDVAIRLMMLLWEIVPAVVFLTGTEIVTLKVLLGEDRVSKGRVVRVNNKLEFILGNNQIECLLGVVLRALANGGVAETPHIHIEALLSDTPYDLTVFFEHVQPPMSQEEVEKAAKSLNRKL